MVTLELKGLHRVRAKGKIYWYAWRGGPRLAGEPGTPEFIASYNEAIANRQSPDTSRFRSLISLYRASTDYQKLAASTKKNWGPWLDRIADHFGELRIGPIRPVGEDQAGDREVARQVFRYAKSGGLWHASAVSRLLSYAVDPLGKIASNPCEGIKQLYSGSRSEIIWTDADIAHLKKTLLSRSRARRRPRLTHRIEGRGLGPSLLVARRR